MTTKLVNAMLKAGKPLESIGGKLEACTDDSSAEIWSFADDDFVALIRNHKLSESDWYSTVLDANAAYNGEPDPYEIT